jgi:ABC-type taurine transport system substrate-binding protein
MKTRVSGVPYLVELPDGMTRWQVFASGFAIGAVLAILGALVTYRLMAEPVQTVTNVTPDQIIQAYNRGIDDALKTNPSSWALEQSCLELWANQQPVK